MVVLPLQVSTALANKWSKKIRSLFRLKTPQAQHVIAKVLGCADWAAVNARARTVKDDTKRLKLSDVEAWLPRTIKALKVEGIKASRHEVESAWMAILSPNPSNRLNEALRHFNRVRRTENLWTGRALSLLRDWDDDQFEFYMMSEWSAAEALMDEALEDFSEEADAAEEADYEAADAGLAGDGWGHELFNANRIMQAIRKRSIRHSKKMGWD